MRNRGRRIGEILQMWREVDDRASSRKRSELPDRVAHLQAVELHTWQCTCLEKSGGNPEAARLAGLNVLRVIGSVYVIMGFFAGLGGFVLSARLNSSEAVAGVGYELTVIASVV